MSRLRSNNPAPVSSISEMATCAVTSAPRSQPRAGPTVRADPINVPSVRRRAGNSPNRIPESTAAAALNSSTRRSTVASSIRGSPSGAIVWKPRSSPNARPHPLAPPATATSRLSVSARRTRRKREAPSAARTAISRSRPTARANSRLAILAQAISSTASTAPNSASEAARASPTCRSRSGRTRSVTSLRNCGGTVSITRAM